MSDENCVGPELPLQCSKHKEKSIYPVKTGQDLKDLVNQPSLICKLKCGDMFECGIHPCERSCLPKHSHTSCMVLVDFFFPINICQYEHKNQKRCHESILKLKCTKMVDFKFAKCGHGSRKECYKARNAQLSKHGCHFYVSHPKDLITFS